MELPPTAATELQDVCARAAVAAPTWAALTPVQRAAALDAAAAALDAAADELVSLAMGETHLPEGRLRGELTRTTFQLRLFGEVLRDGAFLDVTIDHADPDWPMGAPRPDLRRMNLPLGPVAVFAASNFPFAFSVAGGDTASALAAGCPVVVKAHPGHEGLSARTGELVSAALTEAGAPAGTFAVVYGLQAGLSLIEAPEITAGAFTGSLAAGRALFDRAASRPVPIPFYAEMGSVNPTFVTPRAAAERAQEIAAGYAASVTGSSGQLCTKPGLLFAPSGSGLRELVAAALTPAPVLLLNERITAGYRRGLDELSDAPGVETVARAAGPVDSAVLAVPLSAARADPARYLHEVFGPASLVVEYDDAAELDGVAALLDGQLTATVFGQEDEAFAVGLLAQLGDIAGRVLWNQWPTGLSVTWAQTHGGPYPATTASGTTSVGTAAIRRFLRPVTYQNVPPRLLPTALREGNPLRLPRRVDGHLQLP